MNTNKVMPWSCHLLKPIPLHSHSAIINFNSENKNVFFFTRAVIVSIIASDVSGNHRLPLDVLGVGASVPDNVLQEHLQHSPGQPRKPPDASTLLQAADGRLGDALDVVLQHIPVPLGSSESSHRVETGRKKEIGQKILLKLFAMMLTLKQCCYQLRLSEQCSEFGANLENAPI